MQNSKVQKHVHWENKCSFFWNDGKSRKDANKKLPERISIQNENQHMYNLREGHFAKSKLASHTFQEGHKFDWTHACISQFEPNATYT